MPERSQVLPGNGSAAIHVEARASINAALGPPATVVSRALWLVPIR